MIVDEKGGEEGGVIERITEGTGMDNVRAREEERHTSHVMQTSQISDRQQPDDDELI